MMEDKTRAEYNLPPFDVVVRSSWLAKRKCHCPAHIAQSSSPPAAISEDHVVAVVDKLDDASENQQQDLNKPLWNELVFDLRIRCRQVVEHFAATTTPPNLSLPLLPRSPIELLEDHQHHYPCRVKDSRVLVEHNHFINSVNMTTSVVQGQSFLSTLNVIKDYPMPRWNLYGISQVEPEVPYDSISPSNEVWLRLQTNDLPPTGQYLSETILKHIAFDYYWTTSSSTTATTLRDRLSSNLGTDFSPLGHSLETMAMMTGLDRALFALAHSHPLIFSPKRIRWFCDTVRDNRWIVASLLGIYWNATSPGMNISMTQSIQRIRQQFPAVPQGNTALLLETALEALAYRTVMTGGTKSKTTTIKTGLGSGSGCRSRDSSTPLPILNDANNADAGAEMKVPMATNNTNNNCNNNDAREPTSLIQRTQQWKKRGERTNGDLEREKGNDDVVEGFKDTCLQPCVPREPSNEHQDMLFISSSNNNTNELSPPLPPSPPPAATALIPDCGTNLNSPRNRNSFDIMNEITDKRQLADLALSQNCNQQQHEYDDDEQCLELDLEMDEWDKQSEQSDFFDISEEEQQLDDDDVDDEDGKFGLVEEDEEVDLELWRDG